MSKEQTPEQEIKEKVNAPWPEILKSIAKTIQNPFLNQTEQNKINENVLNLKDILNYGLARTTLNFCFEHAVAVSLWTKVGSFDPVYYNGSIVYCDIKQCSRIAVLKAELDVYIDVKV